MDSQQGDIFPWATDILDYYHACERLHDFVRLALSNHDEGNAWAAEQKGRLLESGQKISNFADGMAYATWSLVATLRYI